MISQMLFSQPELRDYKSEEGEELSQDLGEWRGYFRDCKDGLKKCIEIRSCFRYGKTTLEFVGHGKERSKLAKIQ